MKKLDPEEQALLDAFESGALERVTDVDVERARHQADAVATLQKDSRINIRISSRDLRLLQKRALREGLPYQTLISSLLHKYVEGRLTEHG